METTPTEKMQQKCKKQAKWEANNKWLIGYMYLQYESCDWNAHYLHLFLPHKQVKN